MKETMREKLILLTTALLLTLGVTGCASSGSVPTGPQSPDGSGNPINLSTLKEQLVIREAGEYTLTGSTKYGVKADPGTGTVTLHLDNAEITNADSAGIIGESGEALVIDLMEGTENRVADGGDDEDHDGAIYGNVPLIFTGNGSLSVQGSAGEGISTKSAPITFEGGTYTIVSADDGINTGGDGGTIAFNGGTFMINASGDGIDSNADIVFGGADVTVTGSAQGGDAGIDSETGYRILKGTVIALGSDMLEVPQETSEQNSLCLTLDRALEKGSKVELTAEDGRKILSFTAEQAFRTLVLSTPDLAEGKYSLWVNGETCGIGGETVLTVRGKVSRYGTEGGMPGGPGMPGQNGQDGRPPMLPDGSGNGPVPPGENRQEGTPPPLPGQDRPQGTPPAADGKKTPAN